ncbi:unnamed protein product [Echinostoma caproni]|uniref:Saposin B-type domain-containing protein n=1 Tax=Echinostoma caproni TaxID=27848 RepID=A0A183AYI5_9TREM|nr:unnamed protein product [Echinostoma caproni]
MTLLKAQFDDPSSRTAIEAQLKRWCQILDFSELRDGCNQFIDRYFNAWLINMGKNLNPLLFCQLDEENVDYCQFCTTTLDGLKKLLKTPSFETFCDKMIDSACKHTGAMYSMCKEAVTYGIQTVVEFVEKEDPQAACHVSLLHTRNQSQHLIECDL